MKNCLRSSVYDRRISGDVRQIALIEKLMTDLLSHYGFRDIEVGGKHQLRFFLLYVDRNEMTYEEIAEETFISLDKFKKHVRNYNRTALAFINEESKVDDDFATLLTEYLRSGL